METARDVLYETNYHASCSFSPDLSEEQSEGGKAGLFSLFFSRGIKQLKQILYESKRPKTPKKGISLFISPRGDHVAVAAGNQITILQKDDKYMEPCGSFTSNEALITFTHGAWSDSCSVLGVIDNRNSVYFIKSNGEEISRITKSQLKTSAPSIGLITRDDRDVKTSCLCSFIVLTSDGLLHYVDVAKESNAFVSRISTSNNQLGMKKHYPQNVLCMDFHPELSLLVLVGSVTGFPEDPRDGSGFYCLSLWHVTGRMDLKQLFTSPHFEGVFSIPNGHAGPFTVPKVEVSPHGRHIAALDLTGCLDVFNLDSQAFSLSVIAFGGWNSATANTSLLEGRKCIKDIVDFTWWSDHTLIIAKSSGVVSMFDIPSGVKLLENDPVFSNPILGRSSHGEGYSFILECSSSEGRQSIISPDDGETIAANALRWRLISFSERSVTEMYRIFLSNQQYQVAYDFANRHGLDKDDLFKSQWLHSDHGNEEINKFLSNIQDQNFVLRECINRIGPTEDAVKALLSYGLHITDRYRYTESENGQFNSFCDFRIIRLQLLQCKDKLETFMGINMGRFSVHEYSKFRIAPLNEAAVSLAESGKIGALNLLFKRHAYSLAPFILDILSAIPETVPVQTYGQLLPGRSPPCTVSLRERDWVEGEEMVAFINSHWRIGDHESNVPVKTEHIIKCSSGFIWPSVTNISLWYKERTRDIDRLSGQLENSLSIVEFACQKGITELQRFYEDITYLNRIVYSDLYAEEVNSNMGIVAWEQLSDYEKFRVMLKGVRENTVVGRLRKIAVPFMRQRFCEGQVREGHLSVDKPMDSFLVRWLKEIAAENKLDVCLMVIEEGCRDIQIGGFFKDEIEAVEVSLSCIYLCTLTDQWNMMASILSMLPPITLRGKSSVANKEERLVHLNEGDGPAENPERRVKVAEGHVEAGRLLAYYNVAKPIHFFLEAHSDEKGIKQLIRLILSKFGRRQPSRSDNDWANMWRDMQCLQEKVFPFLAIEYMLIEFCRGLLKAGKFSLARNYLRGTGSIALAPEKAENLVIQAAREYFFSASSLDCSEIWKARECLNLIPNSKNVKAEAGIIDALTIKLPNLGVTLLPIQFRQIRSPMEIINAAIASQTGAYVNVEELIEIAKLLGLSSHADISAIQEAVAREAAVTGDLQLAFDLCLVLAKKGHGPVWDLCAAIARGPVLDNMDTNSRKHLLGFALSHCDDESVGELLHAWKDLDMQSQCEKLGLSTGTKPPYFAVQDILNIRHCQLTDSDQETFFKNIKQLLSSVSIDIHSENGTSWDSLLKEDGKFLSFAALQLPWLHDLSKKTELGENTSLGARSLAGKQHMSIRFQAVTCILSWLAINDIAPSDDLVVALAKSTMEAPVTEEEDILGCLYLLNLMDAYRGVEVIEEQMSKRKIYQEVCSIMNIGIMYSSLHSDFEYSSPAQRRMLLLQKFQEKQALFSADVMDKIEKVQSTFWREWKSKLAEQKRLADQTRVLEQTIPELDAARFLSGDFSYIQSAVFSFIDSVKFEKNQILRKALKLADAYGLNQSEVLLRYLAAVLVSEIWAEDEIDAEISDHKKELLDCAANVIDMISSTVYDMIDGHNKLRLAYLYNILSECYSQLTGTGDSKLLVSNDDRCGHNLDLSQFYKVLEQECKRVSFIRNLNFKNIAGLHGLNFELFNKEVYSHVHESSLDTLAQMVQTLVGICRDSEAKGLITGRAVYKHHVLNLLTALEKEIKMKDGIVSANDLWDFLGDLERNYDCCRVYVQSMSESDLLDILAKYYRLSIPCRSLENPSDETAWLECLILLLNLWIRIADDVVEIIHNEDEEKPMILDLESLSKWLRVFKNLAMEGKISAKQVWDTISCYVENDFVGSYTTDVSGFCTAMVFSGCGFGSIAQVLSAAFPRTLAQPSSVGIVGDPHTSQNLARFYVHIIDTVLIDLGNGSGVGQRLHNLLSSLKKLEGDLDDLQGVRFAVWGRLSGFAENMELPSQIRVYALELLQYITRRNNLSGPPIVSLPEVQPWEGWDDPLYSVSSETSDQDVFKKPTTLSRFTSTLVALKSTELISTIRPTAEITPNDLTTIDSAVNCFLRLSGDATTGSHFHTLIAIIEEWEGLFTSSINEESDKVSDSGANSWNDDGWDEGWDDFHEELVEREEKAEGSITVHPLHACWMEIIKKFVGISQFTKVMKLIDRLLANPKGTLLAMDEAESLAQLLLGIDCFVALKITLLLPYEEIWFQCLNQVELKLKQGGFPDRVSGDHELFALILSSGLISTIASESAFCSVFSYLCYLAGSMSRAYQENLLSLIKFRGVDGSRRERDNGCFVFVRVLFPCFVSEIVKAKHYFVAGFVVSQFMHTHASATLINFAEAGLRRYLEGQLQRQQIDEPSSEEVVKLFGPLVNTMCGLRGRLERLVKSALFALSTDMK